MKTADEKYFFKQNEAVDFIIKVSEKVLTKKMEKKEVKSLSTTYSKGKKKKYKMLNLDKVIRVRLTIRSVKSIILSISC
jgi:hypothetical protein